MPPKKKVVPKANAYCKTTLSFLTVRVGGRLPAHQRTAASQAAQHPTTIIEQPGEQVVGSAGRTAAYAARSHSAPLPPRRWAACPGPALVCAITPRWQFKPAGGRPRPRRKY